MLPTDFAGYTTKHMKHPATHIPQLSLHLRSVQCWSIMSDILTSVTFWSRLKFVTFSGAYIFDRFEDFDHQNDFVCSNWLIHFLI